MRLHSYVVARDHGFAPNPFHGVCTFATCMWQIREHAKVGDWLIGTGSKKHAKRNIVGHLVYCMEVEEILSFDEYWRDQRYQVKKPVLNGSLKYRMGDNIYHRANGKDGEFIQANSHHSRVDGAPEPNNVESDTDETENVLIGRRFAYWGHDAIKIPNKFRNYGEFDIVMEREGRKNKFPPEMIEEFVEWFKSLGAQGICGEPGKFV